MSNDVRAESIRRQQMLFWIHICFNSRGQVPEQRRAHIITGSESRSRIGEKFSRVEEKYEQFCLRDLSEGQAAFPPRLRIILQKALERISRAWQIPFACE